MRRKERSLKLGLVRKSRVLEGKMNYHEDDGSCEDSSPASDESITSRLLPGC